MCGRFAITLPIEAMSQLFNAMPANDLSIVPNYNVCPTINIHTVTSDNNGRRLRSMRWGLIPKWYETVSDGPKADHAQTFNLDQSRAAVHRSKPAKLN